MLLLNTAEELAPWEAKPLIYLHKAMSKLQGPSSAETFENMNYILQGKL